MSHEQHFFNNTVKFVFTFFHQSKTVKEVVRDGFSAWSLSYCLRTDGNDVHTFVDTHTHKDAHAQTHCKEKVKT